MGSAGCQPRGAARHVSQLGGTLQQAWLFADTSVGSSFALVVSPSKPRRDISGHGGTGWVARGRRSPRCPRQDRARSGLSLPTPGGGGEEREGKNPAWSLAGRLSWRRPLCQEPLLSHGSSTGGCCTRLTQGPRCLRCSSQNRAAFAIYLVHGEPADAKTPPVPARVDVRGLHRDGAGGGRRRAAP